MEPKKTVEAYGDEPLYKVYKEICYCRFWDVDDKQRPVAELKTHSIFSLFWPEIKFEDFLHVCDYLGLDPYEGLKTIHMTNNVKPFHNQIVVWDLGKNSRPYPTSMLFDGPNIQDKLSYKNYKNERHKKYGTSR